jgi:hypothetical protein
MADGNPSIKLLDRYTHRQRQRVVTAYREWVQRLEHSNGRKVSPQRLSELLDQEFDEFSETMEVENPHFKTIWEERGLDPKTIKNLLTCELKLNLLDIHERSFRMLDAFLQIVTKNPPPYL